MTCGTCIRWRRLPKPRNSHRTWATRYGFCRWPGTKPAPYWHAEHPDGFLVVADCHGADCPAFKEKKR